jgi:uncharacterized protein (TIGR00369 family)
MQVPPFNSYLGIEIVSRENGRAEAALELAPHHLNRRGVAHGGVIGSLLDSAIGAAVISSMPPEWWCATTTLSTQFHDGARSGRLTASGQVLRRGGRIAFASGEVRDERGRLIATAHGSWHLWDRKPQAALAPTRGRVVVSSTGRSMAVGKVVAVGRNYADHVAEMGAPAGRPPVLFLKPPSSVLCGAETLQIPDDAGDVHHEVELVVVIGKRGKAISAERALDHVLGYAVGLDLTLRDVQSEAKKRGEPWSLAKGFDDSAPISPAVDRDEIGDGSGLEISLTVNGDRRQHGNTSQMLRSVPELICRASQWMTLEAGDLLFTGTPAGVGPIRAGDRVEARIEKVGTLSLVVEH